MAKLTIRDLNVRGKRVFLRVDYNVPLEEKDGQMVITDDTRIKETLPTLKALIEQGGDPTVCSCPAQLVIPCIKCGHQARICLLPVLKPAMGIFSFP